MTTIFWVSCSDYAPQDDKPVLIALPDGSVTLGWHGPWDMRWRIGSTYSRETPTHWATLPEAPR